MTWVASFRLVTLWQISAVCVCRRSLHMGCNHLMCISNKLWLKVLSETPDGTSTMLATRIPTTLWATICSCTKTAVPPRTGTWATTVFFWAALPDSGSNTSCVRSPMKASSPYCWTRSWSAAKAIFLENHRSLRTGSISCQATRDRSKLALYCVGVKRLDDSYQIWAFGLRLFISSLLPKKSEYLQ